METRIETTIEFPNGIPCKKDVLGSEFDVIIGNLKGIIAFPRLPENYIEELKSEKDRPTENGLLSPFNSDMELSFHEVKWGVFCDSLGNSSVDNLRIWFPCNHEDCKGIANGLSDKTIGYFKNLILFMEILSGQAFQKKTGQIFHLEVKETIQYWHWDENNRMIDPNEDNFILEIQVQANDKENFISKELVTKAIDYTNKNLTHNLAYILLRDSIYHKDNKENRKAILDASTAIEIAFTRKIKSEFQVRNLSGKLEESLLKKYHSIGGRIELMQSMEIELPCKIEEYRTFLAKIRNKAIHAGHNPSPDEAKKVIEIAKLTVKALCVEYE